MAFLNMSSDLGRKRMEKIHKRVDYLIDKFLYNEFEHNSPNPWQLCKWCKMKKDKARNKPSSENKHYYLQCNKMEWIGEAVAEYHKGVEILWNKQNLMNRLKNRPRTLLPNRSLDRWYWACRNLTGSYVPSNPT